MDISSVKQRFGIIGHSNALNRAISTAIQVAPTDISVLIWGESGVGKEVFSQIIHQLSARKHNKFIAVNCGAIPEGTIDSELFGHEKGSFTGAHDARKGYFETVNGGTIFLDEVGEMPVGTQARLLRLLETGEYIRVGSSQVHKSDVRVIAATNADLHTAISKNKFREDLYYRLNTVTIIIPPLRERKEDIYLLFRKFSNDFAEKYRTQPLTLDDDARHFLTEYPWPGNIRQLRNVTEQMSVLETSRHIAGTAILNYLPKIPRRMPMALQSEEEHLHDSQDINLMKEAILKLKIEMENLKEVVSGLINGLTVPVKSENTSLLLRETNSESTPLAIESGSYPVTPSLTTYSIQHSPNSRADTIQEIDENLSLDEVEKRMIQSALQKHGGKRKQAAQELGISERTLYRKIKEYGLD